MDNKSCCNSGTCKSKLSCTPCVYIWGLLALFFFAKWVFGI